MCLQILPWWNLNFFAILSQIMGKNIFKYNALLLFYPTDFILHSAQKSPQKTHLVNETKTIL